MGARLSASKIKAHRILVRGVNWLGDAVMSTPALMRLREAYPDAQISLATLDKLAALWAAHPAVDRVIAFAKADGVGTLKRELRGEQFDFALVLPNSFRSALEVWLAGAAVRIGYGGNGRRLLLNRVVGKRSAEVGMHKRSAIEIKRLVESSSRQRETFPSAAHQIYNYLYLAAAAGASAEPLAPRLHVEAAEAEEFRNKFGLPEKQVTLGLNAGAEYGPAKRWPRERFVKAAREISSKADVHWVLFGGKADEQTAAEIEQALAPVKVTNLAGKSNLRELCAGLSLCKAVLTNDTGPMHLAAALGAVVVTPFGSTSPELTGPGLPGEGKHRLILGRAPCAPCFRRECPIDFRCMRSIEPDEVARAVLDAVRT